MTPELLARFVAAANDLRAWVVDYEDDDLDRFKAAFDGAADDLAASGFPIVIAPAGAENTTKTVFASDAATVGAVEIIGECLGAMAFMGQQIEQMQGMFDDDDGQIEESLSDWEDASTNANAWLAANRAAGPVKIGVHLEGGVVHSVWASRALPGVVATVIDYDTEGSDSCDLVDVDQGEGATADALVSEYDLGNPDSVAPMTIWREKPDDDREPTGWDEH